MSPSGLPKQFMQGCLQWTGTNRVGNARIDLANMTEFPEILQEHYEDPYHRGSCERATHGADGHCAESECEFRIELAVDDDGQIVDAWFDAVGCRACEGLNSMLMERIENSLVADWAGLQLSDLLTRLGLERWGHTASLPDCVFVVYETFGRALVTSRVSLDEDITEGTQFGGPSLREEC